MLSHLCGALSACVRIAWAQLGIPIREVSGDIESRKSQVAARWRMGTAYATLAEGDFEAAAMLPTAVDGGEAAADGTALAAAGGGDKDTAASWPRPFAKLDEAARVTCPLITIWSDADELWSPGQEVMAAWERAVVSPTPSAPEPAASGAELAVDVSDGTAGGGPAAGKGDAWGVVHPSGRRDYRITGISHFELVASKEMRRALFAAVAEATAALVVP